MDNKLDQMNLSEGRNPLRGLFIVFEGLDGSGTTTHAGNLKHWFEEKEQPTFVSREPSDGPIGSIIRQFLSKRYGRPSQDGRFVPLDEETLTLAFAADRMDHLQSEIIPKLDAGFTVICDRYVLSSLAYQSLKVDYEWVRAVNSRALELASPDLTIFLDNPPAVCLKRMQKPRWHQELYEDEETLSAVRAHYLRAILDLRQDGCRIEQIDSNRPIKDVRKDVIVAVTRVSRQRKNGLSKEPRKNGSPKEQSPSSLFESSSAEAVPA